MNRPETAAHKALQMAETDYANQIVITSKKRHQESATEIL